MLVKNILIALLFSFTTAIAQPDSILPIDVRQFYTVNPAHAPSCDYYLLSPYDAFNQVDPEFRSLLLIADPTGEVLFYKGLPATSDLSYNFVFNFTLQQNGQLSFHNLANPNTKHYFLDSTLTLVDSLQIQPPYESDGHELFVTANGTKYALAYVYETWDLDSLTTFDGFQLSKQTTVQGSAILVYDNNNNLIFTWNGFDYFGIADMDYTNLIDTAFVDFMHANSISLDDNGNILLSIRNFNEVVKINGQTGAIMWRLGGKSSTFSFPNDTLRFTLQHHATLLPNGNISILDNGTYHNPPVARSIEYELDETNNTATLVWEYRNPIESNTLGSTQLLPNGNRLINWGVDFNVFTSPIVEVTPTFDEVLNIDFPPGFTTYRAFCFDLPWQVNRPIITCNQSNGQITLTADSTYTDLYWLHNDTFAQQVTIADTGLYQVFGYNGYGWVGSKTLHVTNLSNPCDTSVGLNILASAPLKVYPNPSTGEVTLGLPNNTAAGQPLTAAVYNLYGKLEKQEILKDGQNTLDLTMLPKGAYLVKVNAGEKFWVAKIVLL